MYDIKMLKAKKLVELIEIAEQIGLKDIKGMKKQDLIDVITKNPDQETSSVDSKPQFEENKQNNFEKRPRNGSNKGHHNKNFSNKKEDNFNKDNRRKYKEPDFEFDGIIESEGVLEIMQDLSLIHI